jgi:hypothetical protein
MQAHRAIMVLNGGPPNLPFYFTSPPSNIFSPLQHIGTSWPIVGVSGEIYVHYRIYICGIAAKRPLWEIICARTESL